MEKVDVKDANGIVQRLLVNLSSCVVDKGTAGITAQSTIGWLRANAPQLLYYDQIAYSLDLCFEQVRQAGAILRKMEEVRVLLTVEKPKTLGGTMIRDRSIQLCMAQEGKIIASMQFSSRQDVELLISSIQQPFEDAEETAANTMDGADYQALISLRAAIVNYLVSSSRTLPAMTVYRFARPLPTLIISYRLYADASRYDEIRRENKVVHPAFCRMVGRALSQ